MSNLISAAFENKSIRHQIINDEPWFVAKDVAEALEISWKGAATLQSINDKNKLVLNLGTSFGERETYFLSEQGVYKLAFRSSKPEAEKFTDWVANVIKQIRQTGSYQLKQLSPAEMYLKQAELNLAHERQIKLLEQKQAEQDQKINQTQLIAQATYNTVHTNHQYYSVVGFCNLNRMKVSAKEAIKHGKALTKLSKLRQVKIQRTHSVIYGAINCYHEDILNEYFANVWQIEEDQDLI